MFQLWTAEWSPLSRLPYWWTDGSGPQLMTWMDVLRLIVVIGFTGMILGILIFIMDIFS